MWVSRVAQLLKNLRAVQEMGGSIPGWGRSPGEGKGHAPQYSGLESSTDYIFMGSQSQTQLSDFPFVHV